MGGGGGGGGRNCLGGVLRLCLRWREGGVVAWNCLLGGLLLLTILCGGGVRICYGRRNSGKNYLRSCCDVIEWLVQGVLGLL